MACCSMASNIAPHGGGLVSQDRWKSRLHVSGVKQGLQMQQQLQQPPALRRRRVDSPSGLLVPLEHTVKKSFVVAEARVHLCLHSEHTRRWLSQLIMASSAASDGDSTSIPSSTAEVQIDLRFSRRRLQVSFTCGACGIRSQRLINPHAYARGTVFVQCAGCEVYHRLVDNLGLIEEYDFRKNGSDEDSLDDN